MPKKATHRRKRTVHRYKRHIRMSRRQRGGSSDVMQDIGFIIPRCVKKKEHNILFKECYNAIRKYHPTVKIVFIDDNSDKRLLEDYPMKNVEIIPSEYIGAGEYLPYYYLLTRKLFKKAILLQDSMILNSALPIDTVDRYKFLFYYKAREAGSDPTPLLQITKKPQELVSLYKSGRWSGCWGSSMIITYDFLKQIEDTIGILRWKDLINTRDMRVKLESAIALACIYLNNDPLPESNTVAGHCYELQVMREYNMIGKNFDLRAYLEKESKIHDKIIKVFNARENILPS